MIHIIITVIRYRIQDIANDPLRRLIWSMIALVVIVLISTIGYMAIESMAFLDAIYMTVITISTVGYQEVQPLSGNGRIFTILVVFLGIFTTTVIVTNAVGIALGTLLWRSVHRRRMERVVMEMKSHYIVCGYGRIGRQIVRDLQARRELFLVIDSNSDLEDVFLEAGIPYVLGDATEDETLLKARIEVARGCVAALGSDAGNVMTVLTARELNPGIFITARIVRSESESKLRRAGANRVINPYQIGGHRIALSVLRPAVHDYFNQLFHFGEEGPEVEIGQIVIDNDSELIGKTIASSNLRRDHGVTILAIQKPDGRLDMSPAIQTVLESGMVLIIIGSPEAVYALEHLESSE